MPPQLGRPTPTMLEIEHDLIVQLRPEAARRDVPVVRLIHDLLGTIATNKLTTAILDDEPAS